MLSPRPETAPMTMHAAVQPSDAARISAPLSPRAGATAQPPSPRASGTRQSPSRRIGTSTRDWNGASAAGPPAFADDRDDLFWIVVEDPTSGEDVYVCPSSGETRWKLDEGAFLLPRGVQGEHWELLDEARGLPYWYNTLTKTATWDKPTDGLIIPLIAVQLSPAGRRLSRHVHYTDDQLESLARAPSPTPSLTDTASPTTSESRAPSTPDATLRAPALSDAHPPQHSPRMPTSESMTTLGTIGTFETATESLHPLPPLPRPQIRRGRVSDAPSSAPSSAEASPARTAALPRRMSFLGGLGKFAKKRTSSGALRDLTRRSPRSSEPPPPVPALPPSSPRPEAAPIERRQSVIPPELAIEVRRFSSTEYARTHFVAQTKRRGLFRRAVPIGNLASWQAEPIAQPLLELPKASTLGALRAFKLILAIMTPPVEAERPNQRWPDETLRQAQELLTLAIQQPPLRDEIFVQLIKQLTRNPDGASVNRGWRLLQTCLSTFAPSKDLERHLRGFLGRDRTVDDEVALEQSDFCIRRLDLIVQKGPRGRPPPLPEIDAASRGATVARVYGEPLAGEGVPRVLSFLAQALLDHDALGSEFVFRAPGDGELVAELRCRIDSETYDLDGLDLGPDECASALKLWFRDLPEPVVLPTSYDDAIAADSADSVLAVLISLPAVHRAVLAFILAFLQRFTAAHVVARTQMGVRALALCWVPALLRPRTDDLAIVMRNSGFELRFVELALTSVPAVAINPVAAELAASMQPRRPAKQSAPPATDRIGKLPSARHRQRTSSTPRRL